MKKVIKKPGKINASRGKPVSKSKSKITPPPTLGFGKSVPLGVFERIGDVGCNTKTIGLKKSERSGYQPTTYYTIQLASMKELAKELKHTACDYTTGIARDELSGVMCKTKATKGPDEIARCKDDLVYPDGPGFVGLDFDGHYPKYKGIGEAIDIFPDGSSLAQVRRASTGSYIYTADGEPLERSKAGCHVYIVVKEARLLHDLKVWVRREQWLKGKGTIKIAKNGVMLTKEPIDGNALGISRTIYEAAPELKDGLVQKRPDIWYQEGWMLDIADLPPHSPAEIEKVDRLIAEAKAAKQDEAARIKTEYQKAKEKELVASGVSPKQAKRTVLKSLTKTSNGNAGLLTSDFPLHFDEIGWVKVSDILAEPDKYDQHSMADPHEPDKGPNRAKLYVNAGGILVHSFVHGRQIYTVGYDAEALMRYIGERFEAGNLNENWLQPFKFIDITPSENDRAVTELARLKVGTKTSIKGEIKQAKARAKSNTGADELFSSTEKIHVIFHPAETYLTTAALEGVLIDKCELMTIGGVYVTPRSGGRFQEATDVSLKHAVQRNVRLTFPDGENVSPSNNLMQDLLGFQERKAPEVSGVIQHPVITEDGILIDQQGYDANTSMYIDCDPVSLPPDPADYDDNGVIDEACEVLNDLLEECVYDDDNVGFITTIAAMLTTMQRPMMKAAPTVAITAKSQAAGKSALAEILSVTFCKREFDPVRMENDVEMQKALLARIKDGHPMIVFDNIDEGSTVDSSLLTTLASTGRFSGRLLGQNKSFDAMWRGQIIFTGNNISFSPDLGRRVLEVALGTLNDSPHNRVFKRPDLVRETLKRRPAVLRALLSIVALGLAKGRPEDFTPSRFPDWDRFVRWGMIHARLGDPNKMLDATMLNSPEHTAKRNVTRCLTKLLSKGQEVTATEIFGMAFGSVSAHVRLNRKIHPDSHDKRESVEAELAEALSTLNPSAARSTKSTGRALARVVGVMVGDLRLLKRELARGSCYRVEKVV